MTLPIPTHDSSKAKRARSKAEGFGRCGRCGFPWTSLVQHVTTYSPETGEGCYPLCQGCWETLGTPDARWPYYKSLLDTWDEELATPETYECVLKALHNEIEEPTEGA